MDRSELQTWGNQLLQFDLVTHSLKGVRGDPLKLAENNDVGETVI